MSKATVTTATALTTAQTKKLTAALQEKFGSQLELETVVDPQILGGVVVTIGSRQYDNSYRARIETIKQQVMNALAE